MEGYSWLGSVWLILLWKDHSISCLCQWAILLYILLKIPHSQNIIYPEHPEAASTQYSPEDATSWNFSTIACVLWTVCSLKGVSDIATSPQTTVTYAMDTVLILLNSSIPWTWLLTDRQVLWEQCPKRHLTLLRASCMMFNYCFETSVHCNAAHCLQQKQNQQKCTWIENRILNLILCLDKHLEISVPSSYVTSNKSTYLFFTYGG